MANTNEHEIQTLHVAYVGRPADPAWVLQGADTFEQAQGDPAAVAAMLAQSDEFRSPLDVPDGPRVINTLYQNMFGHAPDPAGLLYWSNALASGNLTIDRAGAAIAAAAGPGDAATLAAKVAAATAFTRALDRPEERGGYGTYEHNVLRNDLAQVTADHPALPDDPYLYRFVQKAPLGATPFPFSHAADVEELYVAYLHRPADPEGLAFWQGVLDGGRATTAQVAAQFAQSPEYRQLTGGLDAVHVVTALYQNLFSRNPDVEGLNYWAQLIKGGRVTVDQAASVIAAGAQGGDQLLLQHKVNAAAVFTNSLDTPAEIADYKTAEGIQHGRLYLDSVTLDHPLPPLDGPWTVTLVGSHGL